MDNCSQNLVTFSKREFPGVPIGCKNNRLVIELFSCPVKAVSHICNAFRNYMYIE